MSKEGWLIYMKKFKVRYYECYEGFYVVEANSKEEAEELEE